MISEDSEQNPPDLDYTKFRRRLFARRELHWHLLSGSLYERPLLYVLIDATDLDDLVWPSDMCAVVPRRQSASKKLVQGTLFTVCTKDAHKGFAKLKTDANGIMFYEKPRRRSFILTGKTYTPISKGPSEKKFINWSPEVGIVRVYDTLCRFDDSWKNVQQVSIDRVEATYCLNWPPEAAEWITRDRKNCWPSKDIIDKIVEFGCHFVAKAHQSNPDDLTQWRFSFSQAEVILLNSWTDIQKYIYHVLRIIKSEIVKFCGEDKTVLCAYFFKTLMLWACEQKPSEFWTDENIETSVWELLCQMIEWLIERCCPNYFIPGNNMIDHLSKDDDFSNEISSLLHYKEHHISALLSNAEKAYPQKECYISVPNKILHYLQLHLIFGNTVNPLQSRMSGRLMNELSVSTDFLPVLKYLHAGLTQHLQLMISRNGGNFGNADMRQLSSSALNSFALAIEASDPGSSRVLVSLSGSLLMTAEKLILSKFMNNSEFEEDRLQVEDCKFHILRTAIETLMQHSADVLAIPSYFISAAYRANFFYTGLRDYPSAVRQCDEACNQFETQKEKVLEDITKQVFCFMLTSEWSAMFDEDIQAVLGFTALYRSVFKACDKRKRAYGNGRTIVVRLCAIEFLCYVRCQCLRLLGKPRTLFLPMTRDKIPKRSMFSEKYIGRFSNIFLNAALQSSSSKIYVTHIIESCKTCAYN